MDLPLSYLLLRSFCEWPKHLDLTACIWVNTEFPQVQVPKTYIQNGKIQLNISDKAVQNFQVNLKNIQFDATFSGKVESISIPIASILAVYIAESGQKLLLTAEEESDPKVTTQVETVQEKKPPVLTLVE